MSIKAVFGVTDKTVKEGIWLDYGDGEKIQISMVSPYNTEFQKEMNRLQKAKRREIELNTLDDAEGQQLLREVYAKTIVMDWKGIKHPKTGNKLPYSPTNCILLFKEFPHLFSDIREQSQNMALFVAAQDAVAAKN